MIHVILIGAQGSGKGTQAQRLAESLRLKPCASGELLREAIAAGTPLGRAAAPYYERGDLVPDALVIGLILDAIARLDGAAGIILDGFPRTIPQAQQLDSSLASHGQAISAAIYLDVPRATLLERLAGRYICRAAGHVWNVQTVPPRVPGICDFDGSELFQRSDDTTEKIQHRLDIFFAETIQLVDYYTRLGKMTQIDGTASPEQVHEQIVRALRGRS